MEPIGPIERQVRAAQNQSLFRVINERLEALAEAFQLVAESGVFACECADTSCVEQLTLTSAEYEAVRAGPNRFAVLPGHVYLDVERVVSTNERFVVVEKIGKGAEIAAETYSRSAG